MSCQSWSEKLDTFLDGELSASETQALELHLRGCSDCSTAVLGRSQIRRTVQLAGRRFTPRAEFRRAVARQIAPRPRPQLRTWLPALVAAAVLLAAFLMPRWHTSADAFAELADLHVIALASSSPVDVVSSDRHTVKPWFQGRLPFTFQLPELAGTDFTLLGGSMAYLRQQPAAHLVFKMRKHLISVFIFQENPAVAAVFAGSKADHTSFTTLAWSDQGLRYVIISDAGQREVQGLQQLFKQAAPQ